MDEHINLVPSNYSEQHRPQGHADIALLQAAIEAYEAEQLVEQAEFFATATRGRPRVRPDVGLVTHFRYLGQSYRLQIFREVNGIPHHMMRSDGGLVTSPSPAVVVSVNVAPGDSVKAGTQLAVIETMKMEMSIPAPFAGRVAQLFVTSNVQVEAGTPQ